MKRFLLLIALCWLLLACKGKVDKNTINIIQVNSLRGNIFTINAESDGKKIKASGISMISSKIKELRQTRKGEDFILIANSNFIHGTPETFFSAGTVVIDSLNTLGFDMLVIGHRELYLRGVETLEELALKADFPFISANIVHNDGTPLDFIKPYYIDQEKSVAIIGLTSYRIVSQNTKQNLGSLKFIPIREALEKYVPELQAMGIETIIAAGDFIYDSPRGTINEKEFYDFISHEGIDIHFCRGDELADFNTIYTIKDKKDVERKVCLGLKKGVTLGHYRRQNRDTETYTIYRINSEEVKPDEELKEFLSDLTTNIHNISGQILGKSDKEITHSYTAESDLGNLITDTVRAYTGTEIVALNSGTFREGFTKGAITKMDLYRILPFDDTLLICEMTGAQILELLEASCSFKHSKSFLQLSGLSFAYDPQKEAGQRVDRTSVVIGNSPLDINRSYTLTVSHYIFYGGDSYGEFEKFGIKPLAAGGNYFIRSILEKYIKNTGTITGSVDGRIKTL